METTTLALVAAAFFAAGCVKGVSGAAVVALVPFLQSLDLPKDDLVQSLACRSRFQAWP